MTAYFDNAATTFPKPEEVYQFMDTFYRECGVNVGRGQHKLAAKAAALVAETRRLLLDLNRCHNKTVIFTPSATEALNLILRSLICKDNLNIYVSPFEHNAVTRVINYAAQTFKFNVITLAFNKETYNYDLEQIKYQFAENRPNVVIISHASNVCGVIAPIVEICTQSKRYGATNVIDMCQTMGLIDTDLNNNNIDYAVFAAHKTLYGPLGLGGFIMNPDFRLEPLLYGGTGTDSANPLLPDVLPDRYESGSPNIQAISGLNASLKWIDRVRINTIFEKENENHKRLVDLLSRYSNIKIVSPLDPALGIGVVSTVFEGYSSDNIGQILSERDIAVRSGLHCAPDAHRFLGTFPSGTVRFSVGYFNTDEDFVQLEAALEYILENS
ncbi:Cysteine desulfurase [Dehalobacter sp. UNSWDHB]|jgi:cysteine desulfurase family protein|uniref:aminotransferase class V-fold PLP-dependent enzyme n=1 Tax=unclassified Dehalobacter TaxID=2635733 RepID=UPI00028B790F|nr:MULTISPECIES: aminotransferase class V-fold PLP-dependent enzyme [unclassified Dehalobacter]AFV03480.1 Cysteine desulfurase [Dehalobacter sp. DCA]AFV06467.1 Cysteine desulfurase [Dehalobacter sp. CF]EQB22368.1 Cysteine desulfurase [Dehalobacter sp. UNSWDHB]